MSKTVVGLFSSIAEAQRVKQALIADGYGSQDIRVVNEEDEVGQQEHGRSTTGSDGEGIGDKISHFFKSLTGGDEDAHHYSAGVGQGGGLVAVTCDDDEAHEVAAMLKEHGARDIDGGYDSGYEDASDAKTPVYGGTTASTATGQTAIPVVEEELVVGKREVDRGGVRVYSHVVSVPVAEDVTLRDEHINVERRPVDRAATAADFAAGEGGVIELTATGEEAVVGKTSRVVEEVLVGKDTTSHTQAIHDSVRRTEVEVEEIPGTTDPVSTDRVTSNRY